MSIAYLIELLANFIFGFVEVIIALRIFLKFLGASPSAPFVNWIYETSRPLLVPFSGMFPSPVLQGGFVIEFSALFGLIAYAFIAYFIQEVLDIIVVNGKQRQERFERKK